MHAIERHTRITELRELLSAALDRKAQANAEYEALYNEQEVLVSECYDEECPCIAEQEVA
jgi:hypothetical protein